MNIRKAAFALRVVRRRSGDAAILYRRSLDEKMSERLTRVAAISPLALASASSLIRQAAKAGLPEGQRLKLESGPFFALDDDWGARVACYALVASGLRNADRLHKAASHLQSSDPGEAAWWFGLMRNGRLRRTRRALRILLEAVN
ncbi:MAG: DUF7680 family protein [Chthoniobacterales bacterium]